LVIIFNHLNITVYTHTTLEGHERIVGFEVEPMSLGEDDKRTYNDPDESDIQVLKPGEPFRFTYRIRTVVSITIKTHIVVRTMIGLPG
jgi:galactose mutarotase-like enzyme